NTLKKDNQLVCGISWKSKNENFSSDKSILLDLLVPIFQLPNITFVNIQYGDTSFEINELYNKFNIKIQVIDDIDNFNNIDGLAALIDACDFVITVGNVNAHIAGALNKKTYLLLPYSHGKMWYWREYEDDSLWYSSIKIFRQNISNSWTLPLNNLYNELKVTYDR
ncbi:MAG: hypothetical protein EBY16_10265, partial [Gammaproteobacteria bacterium]|nr:hypothetical protein [Gammaproteobacteria bacterium]